MQPCLQYEVQTSYINQCTFLNIRIFRISRTVNLGKSNTSKALGLFTPDIY